MNDFYYFLEKCELCPRKCGVNRRRGERGYCNSGDGFEIASVCIHKGEEPPISGAKGICNVFFSHCNIQCVYCQNHQISDNNSGVKPYTRDQLLGRIFEILDKGISAIGFVSPTHFLPQVIDIIEAVRKEGYSPVTVWNSNAYERPEIMALLEGYIDVFLPDFKYSDPELSLKYSDAPDYPEVALAALKKMMYMAGPRLLCDEKGNAARGMIIRHLVFPSYSEQSIEVLKTIASGLSPKINLSLMSQYHPCRSADKFSEINRTVSRKDYSIVVNAMKELGLSGWVQEHESAANYIPDFSHENPFEKE